ncbi:MAG TPA: PAS domain S-box protein, partial [Coleofasciculaceae cyanobacterium]
MNADSNRHQTPQWLPSVVRQSGQLILAIPVSCLVASLTAFGWLQYKTTTAEEWVQHSQYVRLETKRLLTALLDAETEVRGYELTRRQEFLKRYDSVRVLIPKSLDELQQLVADNPVQSQRLQQIRTLAQARMTLLQRNLQIVKTQPENLTNSLKLVPLVLEGQQTMDRTRVQISQFLAQEERLQAERDEYLNAQRNLTWLVLALSAAIGIGGSLFAAYLLNRLETRLIDRDRTLRESEARYRAIAENFPNGAVLLFNSQLRYLLADGLGLATVGMSKEQIEGKTIWECLPEEMCVAIEPIYRQALAGTTITTEISYGDQAYIIHALPMRNSEGDVFAGMVVSQDITELKASQAELYRVNRALKTLSECNQTLVRATEESTLLENICQNIIDFGGYHSVWIGYAEQDEAKTVHPVAQVGFEQGYLESQQISWCPSQNGSSPVATAICTKSAQIFQNVLTDPNYSRWREAALKQGYTSSITLPLLANEQPLGALSIYATDPNAFDEAEVKLLIELANDLVYGITALRTHHQRQQAEAALQESQQRLNSILSSIEDVVWSISATTYEVLYINQAAEKVYGRSVTEFYDNPNLWLEVVHPEDQQRVSIFNQSLHEQGTVAMEYRIVRSDGEVRWLYNRGTMTCDTSNRGIRFDGIVTDITERKQAEALLRDSEAKFRAFLESASEAIIVTNAKGEIVMFNAKAEELFGYNPAEVLGRSVECLMPERYRHIHPRYRKDYQAHPVQRSMSKTKDLFAQR